MVVAGSFVGVAPVYSLTVDEARLYYANGILVTNTTGEDHAADELRYACMHFGELQRSSARGQQGRRYGVKTARTTAPAAAKHQTLPPAVNVPQGPGRGRDVFERALANARGEYDPGKKLREMGYK